MIASIKVWRDALGILAQAGRGLALAVAGLTLAEAGLGLAVLWLIKSLIETLTTQGLDGPITMQVAFIFAAIVLMGLVSACGGYLRIRQGIAVSEIVDKRLHEKAISVDYGFYESPDYFDSLQRARQSGVQRPAQMVGNALLLLRSLAFLIGAAVLLASVEWRILPALLISILVVLAVRLSFTRRLFEWQKSRAQLERRATYTDMLMTSDHHAKDLRLAGMGASLLHAYQQTRAQINDGQFRIERGKAVAEALVSILGAVVFAAAAILLLQDAANNSEAIGNIVLFILVFRRAETTGREMVQSMTKLYDDRLYLSQLFDFLNVQAQVSRPAHPRALPEPVVEGLRLDDVSFAYPNARSEVLSHVDLDLPKGKIVALVGENGSGKTTLIKLLTRLYDPAQGQILLDGVDTTSFDPVAFRNRFSVVFQNFAVYADTLRRNVAAAHMAQVDDDDRILDALERAGAADLVRSLPNGLDTMLSRMFQGGQELSIGQWQRVALARALFRPSDFLILDEPSSAQDPRAEFEIFDDLRERAEGRGVLMISHRLSSVRMADYTYVLDNGRIIEHGTHDSLAAADGPYSALFELQARRYR